MPMHKKWSDINFKNVKNSLITTNMKDV